MLKTIFSKLVVIFILILLFSFSVSGIMLYFFLGNLVSTEKEQMLDYNAEQINSLLDEYIDDLNNPVARGFFNRILNSYSVSTKSLIWVVNSSGYIVFAQPSIPSDLAGKLKDSSGYIRLPDERQYKRVMQGQESSVKEIGDFYGLLKQYGTSWLTIEKPFKRIDSDGKEKVLLAVYLHTPIPEIQKARQSVYNLFIASVAVSVLISIVLVYIFSLRISRPLKEINEAARVIAGGEFQKRLNIESEDEIGELAKSFNHMVVALENLEEMRRGFIANVSHELRTPMTSIRGFIEGILDGTIPPERHRDYLNIVRDETIRLNKLVNDLLDLARMEAGEMTFNFKNFNINELMRRCIIKLENSIVQKEIEIEADFEEEEIYVNADADGIERVIINLIHNAIKFTPERGKITLTTSSSKDKVLVSVKDTGIGISSDEINLIWERFYKSDKSRSSDKTGTGLGLAIIKNIINEHNQEIWVESKYGEGANFIFTLDKEKEGES